MCQYLSDLSIAMIGAFAGIAGAFYLFKRTLEANRKIDAEKQTAYLTNRVRFFVNLLEEVVKKTKDQIQHFEAQGENIIGNPYKLDFPKLLASSQLDRLKGIDSISLFEGYILLLGDSEATVEEYNFMLYQIDYLDKRLSQLMESNERNIMSLASNFEQMRLSLNELYSHFPEFYDFFGDEKYSQILCQFNTFIGTGEVDVRSLQTEFLIPLFTEIRDMVVKQEFKEKQALLISLIRASTSLIEHIRANNLNYAESDALHVGNDLQDVFGRLEEIKKKLTEKLKS